MSDINIVPRKKTAVQQTNVEAEVLQNCIDDISQIMHMTDAELFGTLLVQYEIASETVVSGPIYSPDIPDELRIIYLLKIVESTIKEIASPKDSRVLFNKVVEIIADPLGCIDAAQALVTMCSKFTYLQHHTRKT